MGRLRRLFGRQGPGSSAGATPSGAGPVRAGGSRNRRPPSSSTDATLSGADLMVLNGSHDPDNRRDKDYWGEFEVRVAGVSHYQAALREVATHARHLRKERLANNEKARPILATMADGGGEVRWDGRTYNIDRDGHVLTKSGARHKTMRPLLDRIDDGDYVRVALLPDPGNRYDRNAIMVLAETTAGYQHVGHLPREVAEDLAPDFASMRRGGAKAGLCEGLIFEAEEGSRSDTLVSMRLNLPTEYGGPLFPRRGQRPVGLVTPLLEEAAGG